MRAVRGFTLIEVTIALALLALILLGLMGALRAMGDVGARAEARAEWGDELRLVPVFLDRALRHASAHHKRLGEGRPDAIWFQGETDRLEWLGIMPARHGAGGLSHFRLVNVRSGANDALAIHVTPYAGGDLPDWVGAAPEIIIGHVTGLVIEYKALNGTSWSDRWDSADILPGWVRIRVQTALRTWPELVFRLHEAAAVPGAG